MTISTLQQTTEVTEVGSVVITEAVSDTDEELNTIYTREVRVYKEPVSSESNTLLFTLRLTAATKEAIELEAPVQTF